MNEDVRTAVVSKEAVALYVVKPLHCAFVCHGVHLFSDVVLVGSRSPNAAVNSSENGEEDREDGGAHGQDDGGHIYAGASPLDGVF